MNVKLVDYMGSDLSVVNAARVSFDKASDWEYEYVEDVDIDFRTITTTKVPKNLKSGDEKLIAFARVCNLRLKKDTQKETRFVAEQIDELATKLFPVSWKHLKKV
jgi:thymidylate synthase ThyX